MGAPLNARQPVDWLRGGGALHRALLVLASNLDALLLAFICGLVGTGLMVLYSASGESVARVSGQAVNVAVAFAVMWLAAKVPPNHLMRIALPAYLVGLALLVGVALFGEITNGARSGLQPSCRGRRSPPAPPARSSDSRPARRR